MAHTPPSLPLSRSPPTTPQCFPTHPSPDSAPLPPPLQLAVARRSDTPLSSCSSPLSSAALVPHSTTSLSSLRSLRPPATRGSLPHHTHTSPSHSDSHPHSASSPARSARHTPMVARSGSSCSPPRHSSRCTHSHSSPRPHGSRPHRCTRSPVVNRFNTSNPNVCGAYKQTAFTLQKKRKFIWGHPDPHTKRWPTLGNLCAFAKGAWTAKSAIAWDFSDAADTFNKIGSFPL